MISSKYLLSFRKNTYKWEFGKNRFPLSIFKIIVDARYNRGNDNICEAVHLHQV